MKDLDIGISYNTSDNDLEKEFYRPCLQWAKQLDRGVGYFTSGWIAQNAIGLSDFAARGGKIRWILSPALYKEDYEVFVGDKNEKDKYDYFRNLLCQNIEQLEEEMEEDTRNVFAWMLFDKILEIRFAIPKTKLEGDFHDKFGIFSDGENNRVSFVGSVNDTKKGFSNYESIKVFKSWVPDVAKYVEVDAQRFQHLWGKEDNNIKIYTIDQGIRDKIFSIRTGDRPYHLKQDKWHHQKEAVEAFLEQKHGILEMATGTGKTRTALQIMEHLFDNGSINRCIITMYGNDLLDQWNEELQRWLNENIIIFKHYNQQKDMSEFFQRDEGGILLISREAKDLKNCMLQLEHWQGEDVKEQTLFLFDEVHGMGSEALRNSLSGLIQRYRYRLGLSATPTRDFDEAGNQFIQDEIGPVIYQFGLEQAIENGILCEFDYRAIGYELLDAEKQKKREIIARYEAMRKANVPFDEEEMYRALADVNKQSEAKLPLFKKLLEEQPSALDRCIIFVANKEYGEKVQSILVNYIYNYHTYYSEDKPENLERFASGKLGCLITCKKISEGIDIKSVKNIILFSSDKGKLVTTQRIGRSLRVNDDEPDKRALVVDFICEGGKEGDTTDSERKEWLTSLSKTRRKER